MASPVKKITVIGGTGMLGKPVVRALVRGDYEVTAMVRNLEKAKRTLPDEVKLVSGDLQNRDDIIRALEDAEGVYLNLSTRPETPKYAEFLPERDGVEQVLSVVSEMNSAGAGIRRIGVISSLVHRCADTNRFDWWLFEIKKWAVKALREAQVPVTIFYPSTFMETMDQGGVFQGRRLVLVGKSRQPMHFIAGADYGRMVAEAFRVTGDQNCEFDIQGPEPLTFEEAALTFVKNYRHGPVKISRIPLWLMKAAGIFSNEVQYLARMMEALNSCPEPWSGQEAWNRLGRPKITFAEYVKKL